MTGFSRRPLANFVCCLLAGMLSGFASAELPSSSASGGTSDLTTGTSARQKSLAATELPLRLRKERKFNVLGKKKKPAAAVVGIENPVMLKKDDSYPSFVIADRITGQVEVQTEAFGNVELRRAGSQVYADRLTYRPLDDELEATGSVRLLQEGAEVLGPHLRMKLSEQTGSAENVSYRFVREVPSEFYSMQPTVVTVSSSNSVTSGAPMMLNVANSYGLPTQAPPNRTSEASGQAERIDFEGENQFSLFSNTYSTCKPDQADWYLQTSRTHLDYDSGEGTARHASLWFLGAPIVYSPVMGFPLNSQRRTGILHPHFSASTRNGFDFTLPYYINLAPNYDLTLFPRYLSKRGFQIGAEARYLDFNYQGATRFEYLPNDEIRERRRYGYRIEHTHNLGRGVSATINWNGVSDDYYWQDLSSRLLLTSQVQLPKQVMLSYVPTPWLQTNLQVQRYQTLQLDPTTTVSRPYYLEPQLNLFGYKPNVLGTDLSMLGQYTRFTHVDATRTQGDRLVFYPQLSLPYVHPAFQFTPKIGLHMSQYRLERQAAGEPDSFSRVLPTFSLDSTVVFEREGDWFGKGYIQTLEPRLYYVNIPYKDQSRLPLFDTGISDFNFAQIFSENRYSGYDRINDANQLTAAVTTRLLDGETGVERFKAMLGQRYYFKPQRVSIPGETSRQTDFSNVIAAVNGLIAPKTYTDVAWEYNYRERFTPRFAAGVRYQPDYGRVFSASYRYTRDSLTTALPTVDQVDFAGQWPISSRWYAVGRYNYSLRDKRVLESIGGIEYNAGCWALRLVGQRLAAISGKPNDSFFLQLELNDFGSIGSNPIGLLRRSIPGYGKVNELPSDSSLFNNP